MLESLRSHTSFHIGGMAQYWYEPKDRDELIGFLKTSHLSLPLFVIGAGSNLLIKDGLIKKIFIHLNRPAFNKIQINGTAVCLGAGVLLRRLVAVLKRQDLGGYEFLAGIPGTVGGALVTNAGARIDMQALESYREMKDIVCEVEVLGKDGRVQRIKKKNLKFSYRHSNLKPSIILSAKFKLRKADKKQVQKTLQEILRIRVTKQDWRYPSAGSFFKNPQRGLAAGWLIDCCRLKGLRVGGAQVSEKHANFIINAGQAKSTDVLKLMAIVQRRVYDRFKIKLEPEVEIVY